MQSEDEDDTRHVKRIHAVVNDRPGGGPQLDGYVSRSWRRCMVDYELDPAATREPQVVESVELEARREDLSQLLSIAKLEMTNLYQQVADAGYAILLTDRDGVVLNYVGDPVFNGIAAAHALQNGAVWSEQAQGTNGMGTCLVERRPVVIHRREHFFAKNTALTCSSAPILAPDGTLVAVLDASSQSRMTPQHTVVLVNMSAQMIENSLYLSVHEADHIARFHSRPEFVSTLGEGTIAFDESGRVLSANRSALFQLDLDRHEQITGRNIEEIFGLPFSALVDLGAHSSRPAPLHYVRDGRRLFTLIQRPQREHVRMHRRHTAHRAQAEEDCRPSPRKSGDPVVAENIRRARRLFDSGVPVMLYGETGTGKGVFARHLHQASSRSDQPFIAVNCASTPADRLEGELFGCPAGAAGGRGKIVQAHGGTLFLDEISDMPAALQARLLQVLDDKEVLFGGESPFEVDLRVISATHRRLPDLVAEGRFREDLFYRLHGATVTLPPLRERADKRQLIERLLRENAVRARPSGAGANEVRLTPEALDALARYPWPGNIRQLRNTLRTVLALNEGDSITVHDLPDELRSTSPSREASPPGNAETLAGDPLAAAERAALMRELEDRRWNIAKAARALRLSRNTLYRKMKRYDIRPPR